MPYQVSKDGKWFCRFCKDFSDDSYFKVHDHETLKHLLPKDYWSWNKLLEKRLAHA